MTRGRRMTLDEAIDVFVYGKWKTSSQQGEISWIEDENGKNKEVLEYGEIITCKCSNCGYEMGELALGFNFCPNCGARMKESKEEE